MSGFAKGFTVAELVICCVILILISTSVIGDIARTRWQEELNSSARTLVSNLRSMQSRALSASSVAICIPTAGVTAVCEANASKCGVSTCDQTTSPTVYGVTIESTKGEYSTFVDVNGTLNYREDLSGYERIATVPFSQSNPASPVVSITELLADDDVVGSVSSTITFNRQSGSMRINACLSEPCDVEEAQQLSITLTHARSGKTKTIYLNAVTGRIEIQ
jgi:Tfp pilus assembly protein FimT